MVLMAEPVYRAVADREGAAGPARPLIALAPHGRPFDQAQAERLAQLDSFSLLCGRYEGIDQRILDDLVDEELSIGDFVLAGGEIAALAVIEATARLLPGVLGNDASSSDESFTAGLLEYPQWTKPASFRDMEVPAILRSGDHGKVAAWRHAAALRRTMRLRPDLIEVRGGLSAEELELLASHPEVEDTAPTG